MCNLCFKGFKLIWVFNLTKIYTIFVSKWIEYVHIFNCIFSPLFVAINKINPLIDSFRDMWTFKSRTYLWHKKIRIAIRPKRKLHIIDRYFILGKTVIIVVFVDEHLGKSVYFWYQFTDISRRSSRIVPWTPVTIEQSVRHIEFSTLQNHCSNAIGPYPYQEIKDNRRGRVVGTKMILIEQILLIQILIFIHKMSNTLLISLQTHILVKVTICFSWIMIFP